MKTKQTHKIETEITIGSDVSIKKTETEGVFSSLAIKKGDYNTVWIKEMEDVKKLMEALHELFIPKQFADSDIEIIERPNLLK